MGMFDDFKYAWRQAVDNFWQELEGDDAQGSARGAYREVAGVRNQLDELKSAIDDTRHRLTHETEQAEACVRRERMARNIGDEETARVAAEYRARHQERADVLRRKLDVLEAEQRLCARDLTEMERALQDRRVGIDGGLDGHDLDLDRHPQEDEFRNLEDSHRNRSAEERLEELKRRMGG